MPSHGFRQNEGHVIQSDSPQSDTKDGSYEAFFICLLRAGITLLCDVRRNPVSRKWGFSKRMLLAGCDRLGIEYRHLPDLG